MANHSPPSYGMLLLIGFLSTKPAEGEKWYGAQLMRKTGFKSGSLYPILNQLVDKGIAERSEERGDPKELERPLRVFYSLTSKGRRYAVTYRLNQLIDAPIPKPFDLFE